MKDETKAGTKAGTEWSPVRYEMWNVVAVLAARNTHTILAQMRGKLKITDAEHDGVAVLTGGFYVRL